MDVPPQSRKAVFQDALGEVSVRHVVQQREPDGGGRGYVVVLMCHVWDFELPGRFHEGLAKKTDLVGASAGWRAMLLLFLDWVSVVPAGWEAVAGAMVLQRC